MRRRARRRSTGSRPRSIARVIAGPRSNVAFLAALCRAGEFRAGQVRHRLHRPQSRGARRGAARGRLGRRGARRRRICSASADSESSDGDAPADEPSRCAFAMGGARRLSARRHALARRAGHRSTASARPRRSAMAQDGRASPSTACGAGNRCAGVRGRRRGLCPAPRPADPRAPRRFCRRDRAGRRRRRRHQGADARQGAGGAGRGRASAWPRANVLP